MTTEKELPAWAIEHLAQAPVHGSDEVDAGAGNLIEAFIDWACTKDIDKAPTDLEIEQVAGCYRVAVIWATPPLPGVDFWRMEIRAVGRLSDEHAAKLRSDLKEWQADPVTPLREYKEMFADG